MMWSDAGCDGVSDDCENQIWTTLNKTQTMRVRGPMMKPRLQRCHASSDCVIDSAESPYYYKKRPFATVQLLQHSE